MNNTFIKDALVRAKALIEDPNNWCKGTYTYNGRFCSLGTLMEDCRLHDNDFINCLKFLNQASNHLDSLHTSVTTFNDNHTHSEVMEMWDLAIKLA